MATNLDGIFGNFQNNLIFKNKSVLQINHKPEEIPHRDREIEQVASILAPVLRGEKPSNLFLYGKTGTGKTLTIQYVSEELLKRVSKDVDFKLRILYLNCKLGKVSETEYRIWSKLMKQLGIDVPDTGLPTQAVYAKFIEALNKEKQMIILVLDEIDETVKKLSDTFLYDLTRLNSELSESRVCFVGISNDLTFLDTIIDPRARSSLSEEEILFPPYNAVQLQDILRKRSSEAFNEGVLDEGVIPLCAALAAKEHGDARRALDLLRVAAELAERDGTKKIIQKHLNDANHKIERDKILDFVKTEPKQFQLVLHSIIALSERNKNEPIFTGDVWNFYQELCLKNKIEVLTQRRVGDIIQEFDMHGLINVRVISKGRGGRMREIRLAVTQDIISKVKDILQENLAYA